MTTAQVLVIDGEAKGRTFETDRSSSRISVLVPAANPSPMAVRRTETMWVHCLANGVDRYLVASSKLKPTEADIGEAWRLIRGSRHQPAWSAPIEG